MLNWKGLAASQFRVSPSRLKVNPSKFRVNPCRVLSMLRASRVSRESCGQLRLWKNVEKSKHGEQRLEDRAWRSVPGLGNG